MLRFKVRYRTLQCPLVKMSTAGYSINFNKFERPSKFCPGIQQTFCNPLAAPPTPPPGPKNPCYPSPCGINAQCRVENGYAACECLPEYRGNPYEGCRPECLASSDCPMDKACIRNKCQDPCPGTCGVEAICTVGNHIPICSCPEKYTGDAFRLCTQVIGKSLKLVFYSLSLSVKIVHIRIGRQKI